MKIGALEAGGTKMVCAVGDETGKFTDRVSIPTESPEITMPKLIEYFKSRDVEALGIGCFGPIDLNRKSETYGYILKTTKLKWIDFDFLGTMKKELDIPMGFDTDVNGSVLGEVTFGQAKGLDTVVYITIGTGVGAGVYINGRLLHGAAHPEAGHILMIRHPKDTYEGWCPYHGICLEGMASGSAMKDRWGRPASELTDNDLAWEIEADYLAQAITAFIYTYAPQKIIIGGGVMHSPGLFERIHSEVLKKDNHYASVKELDDIKNYIVLPSLNDDQGIMGALALGYEAAKESR
ncbi:MAG: ROK family protein [Lachnospiraceae bacterium]|nr:ROK family protein [Lachnospiraceae bacterium]